MATSDKIKSALGMIPVVGGAASTIYGIGNAIFGKSQLQQQGELQQQQIQGAKQLADISEAHQLDIWNKTNVEAQMAHLKAAGLNPAEIYGGSGAGGATVGSGSAGVPSAPTAPNSTEKMTAASGMGLMLGQEQVLQTQAAKNQADANLSNVQAKKLAGADTTNTEADTGLKTTNAQNVAFDLSMKKTLQDLNIQKTQAETQSAQNVQQSQNIDLQTKMSAYKSQQFDDPNSLPSQAIQATMQKTLIDLQNAKEQNNILKGQEAIQNFEIELNKAGLTKHDPEWERILGQLMTKAGLNPLTK
jgi:hypothetical protein